jgi:hypothetical protein
MDLVWIGQRKAWDRMAQRKYLQYKGLGFSCSCLWLCSFHDLSLLVERGKHLLSFSSLGIGEQYYAGEH